jgi:hypothetical protein
MDFEDRRRLESSDLWLVSIPRDLTNGQDSSYDWFLLQSDMYSDEPIMWDFFLRGAAQRGSALAMMILGELRADLEFDNEALRWFRRAEFLLQDPRNEPEMGIEDRQKILADARENAEIAIANGADPGKRYPRDVGVGNELVAKGFTYCLTCGKLKINTAPIDQCDDSVHMEFRQFTI